MKTLQKPKTFRNYGIDYGKLVKAITDHYMKARQLEKDGGRK